MINTTYYLSISWTCQHISFSVCKFTLFFRFLKCRDWKKMDVHHHVVLKKSFQQQKGENSGLENPFPATQKITKQALFSSLPLLSAGNETFCHFSRNKQMQKEFFGKISSFLK